MKKLFVLAAIVMLSLIAQSQNNDWATYYEKSNFLETPQYDETVKYSKKLAEASKYIEYSKIGTSPQGRDIPVLIVDKNGNFTPSEVRKSGNVVLFVEACIHAGESEGKDAGLMLIRDLIIDNKYPNLLKHTTILFIPIFNVDGHERFSPYNRINQNGPKEMGWRTTAQNYNLNRDFAKADAPEMKAWLKFFNEWLPDMFIDVHTTDGANYQYQLTYGMHILGEMNQTQTDWQKKYLNTMEKQLKKDNVLIFPYVSFRRWHDPKSGLIRGTASPRFSTGYVTNQNRPALLVETHMLKNYKTRVDATYHLLQHTLEVLDNDYEYLKKINKSTDQEAEQLAGKDFILDYKTSLKDSTTIKFKGVEYDIVKSDLTDGDWVKFTDKPKDYELELFDKIVPEYKVKLPDAYIIPVEYTDIINRLKLHGIKFKILEETKTFDIQTYKFNNVQFADSPYENHQMVTDFNYSTINLKKEFRKGSVIVPVNQRSAKIIAHLLEPLGPDSFLRWGYFNSIFERKEYAETYVMEKMARKMIEKNPSLKDEYEKAVKENPDIYNNQWVKLYWFYARTPYWDQQLNVYPIGRIVNQD